MLPSYDEVIEDDAVIDVGRLRLHTIHTPGHTPGSMCFLLEGHPILFSGDTLFPGGPGNTSYEGGDFPTIIESVDRRLFTLPRRHDRAPRPRRPHHDRRRAAPPPGVDRPGLVIHGRVRHRRTSMNLGGPELLIVLVVVMLLFGSKKVPELARSFGKAQREFKEGLSDVSKPSDPA